MGKRSEIVIVNIIDKIEKKNTSYSLLEEMLHAVSHGIGIIFGIVGLAVLIVLSSFHGKEIHFFSYLIYGCSFIFLYTVSTLYHAIPFKAAKAYLKICDHSAIYIFIAGSYTPFVLLHLKTTTSYILLIIVWFFTLCGCVLKLFLTGKYRLLSTLLYVLMGWLVLVDMNALRSHLPSQALFYLLLGGALYTVGAGFYLLRHIPFHHVVWHFFVLIASICHYIALVISSNWL